MIRTLTPLALLTATGLLAQPTIPQITLDAGDQLVIDVAFPITGAGPGGNNVTWNFADPGFSSTQWTYTAIPAASAPMAADFPGSTMALYAAVDQGFMLHAFFDLANGFTDHGEHVSDGGPGISSVNTDPMTFYTTPLLATSSGSDTYGSMEEFAGLPATLSGVHNWTVDGYGTLILPNATYTNVLRIHAQQVETLYVDLGAPFELVTSREEWWWVKAGIPLPLLVFSLETDDFGTEIGATAAMVSFSGSTGFNEKPQAPLLVQPNPANTFCSVRFPGMTDPHVRLLDATGQVLLDRRLKGFEPTVRIDLEDRAPGVYLLQAITADGMQNARIIHP